MIYQDVYSQQLAAGILPSADFIEDDLPLPSFQEVFGFTVNINSSGANIKNGKRKSGEGVDARHLSKRLRIDDFGGGGGKIVQHDSGRWTADEHRLFLEGVMLYGKDWKKMQPLIKTRTLVQIRTHAQKVFKKIGLKKIGNDNAVSASNARSRGGNGDGADNAPPNSHGTSASTLNAHQAHLDHSSNFRGSYDMEVTDEEFNLVVQHLKNLGEIRGDDLSDENDDGAGDYSQQMTSSGHQNLSDHQNHLQQLQQQHGMSQRLLDPSVAQHLAYNSVYQHMMGNMIAESQTETSNQARDDAGGEGKLSSSSSSSTHNLSAADNNSQTAGTSTAAANHKVQLEFVSEEELHNQHLLQALRQYLMPDNDQTESYTNNEFFN